MYASLSLMPAALCASLCLVSHSRQTDVLSLNPPEVRATIERVMVECVSSILSGHGFSYSVPSRSSGNQLYVPELDRIVLKDNKTVREFAHIKNGRKAAITTRILGLVYELCKKQIHVTKRDLFYTDVKLFTKQGDSDDVIEDVACMLGCTRTSLNGQCASNAMGVQIGMSRSDTDAGQSRSSLHAPRGLASAAVIEVACTHHCMLTCISLILYRLPLLIHSAVMQSSLLRRASWSDASLSATTAISSTARR
jgi:hypothetical protein